MRRRLRPLIAAASVAVVVALLSGCAPAIDPAWRPPTWPTTELQVVDAPPPYLDAEAVAGLAAQRLRNDDLGIQARFAYLPGTGPAVAEFNAALEAAVRGAIAERAATVGTEYRPTVFPAGTGLASRGCVTGSTAKPAAEILADPDLGPVGGVGAAVVCDVVAAAGPVFAERIRVVSGSDEGIVSDTTTTLYVDTTTGAVATAEDLWTDAAPAELGDDVVEALRRDAGALSLTPSDGGSDAAVAEIRAALASTQPAADGTLAFTIAPGFTTPELTELGVETTASALTIHVPADVARPMLTDLGAAVLDAAGTPYAGPAVASGGTSRLDCGLVPCVALTYDDGPVGLTSALLDDLQDAGAAATFFMLGSNAQRHPDIVRRVAAEGHEIGTHTWNHPHLPELDDADVAQEVGDSRALLQRQSGQRVAMFRPPYGEYDDRVLAIAGIPAILWTVDTRDWAGPDDDVLIRRGVDEANPGGIILFHDIHERSVRVAPAVIAGLRDRGFSLVTLTQLFHGALPQSGAWRAAPQP